MPHLARLKILRTISLGFAAAGTLLFALPALAEDDWHVAKAPLMTRWAVDVSPQKALPEYPRPQLVRADWQNLNGLWDYAVRPKDESKPDKFDGKILVPFPIESALSGVMGKIGETNRLWYRRTFQWPEKWQGQRALLHIGAVDWDATVYVNGKEAGKHRGGYGELTLDITDQLNGTGEQELVVSVWDPTDAGMQPRGKQVRRPNSIWYTSVTGIWQTVWIEPVPELSIDSLLLVPDIDSGTLTISATLRGNAADATLHATALDGAQQVAQTSGPAGESLKLSIPNAKLWSPDSPHLYDLKISVQRQGKSIDEVSSYFAMRKISLMPDEHGVLRLALNNKPLFQFGPLDQGWWPDGLYTAPTDQALRFDIEVTKKLGFNMARKHVKVEPDRWYYWCDKLGLIVWQDMPSAFETGAKNGDQDKAASKEAADQFDLELKEMIDQRRNHPSIVMWVPFNEGWGQHDTARVVDWIKAYDPTRLVDDASGWTDRNVGDVFDMHKYPGPGAPKVEAKRAGVLGEFGGLGLPVPDHTWQNRANWSYKELKNRDDLTNAYLELLDQLKPLIESSGLSAAVYTQTTDVEIELNGLMTYDRAITKMDTDRVSAANVEICKTSIATGKN
jgi:beta-galactosidase/beta-glucuronidase